MKKHFALLYFFVFSVPLLLGIVTWQSFRYKDLEKEVRLLEATQEDWIESNKKLIAGNAVLSSSRRIELIAVHDLRLSKMQPEDVLQIRIEEVQGQ